MKKPLLFFLILFSVSVFSQKLIGKVAMETKRTLVRWAVVDSTAFRRAFRMGYILERVENDSLFADPSKIKRFLIFPDSSSHPDWEILAKEDQKALFVHQLLFTYKPFPTPLLHLAGAAADQNFKLARAMGWGFIDSTVLPKRNYFYRIRVSGIDEMPLLKKSDNTISPIRSFKIKQEEKKLVLSWNVEKCRGEISGYFIEKRELGRVFKPLNVKSIVEFRNPQILDSLIYYSDSLLEEGKKYEYRMRAIDYFGRVGAWSETIEFAFYSPLQGDLRIVSSTCISNGSCELLLDQNEKLRKVSTLLYIGKSLLGNYSLSLNSICNLDTIRFPCPATPCYLKVIKLGKSGDTISSLPYYYFVPDTIPPKPPNNVTALVHQNGLVELNWSKNVADKIFGYRLFRSNSKREEFVEVNRKLLSAPSYVDTITLLSLSPQLWYFVVALDSFYNNSAHSDTIQIQRPDTIPPQTPVIEHLETSGNTFYLRGYIDRQMKDSVFVEILGIDTVRVRCVVPDSGKVEVIDSTFKAGSYTVCLISGDKAGNRSRSLKRSFSISHSLSAIAKIESIFIDRKQKSIQLGWKLPTQLFSLTLYRSKNEGLFSPLVTLSPSAADYSDKQLYMGNQYHYQLVFLFQDGTKVISEVRSVIY